MKKDKQISGKKPLPSVVLGLPNLLIFFGAVAVLVLGYVLMSIGPWDNPLSRSVAPIVLLVGYLILIPLAIFYRPKALNKSDNSVGSK